MPEPANYALVERLRDGSVVEIRALQPDDREDMLAAIGRTSANSMQRRFFVPKRGFSEQEIAFFMNIDFHDHVALVAEVKEDDRSVIVGGGRYIVTTADAAELAFVVIDAYQGKGIGSALLRHLIELARDAGLKELAADVLPDNSAMLGLFGRVGFRSRPSNDPQVRHLVLNLN